MNDTTQTHTTEQPAVGTPVDRHVRPLPAWDAPGVQEVYAILCSDDVPPDGEHWEGFAARRIVAALTQSHEQALSVALADAQMVNDRLRAAALEVIEFNRQHAHDQYGDADKCEAWACVRTLRAALEA